MDEKKLNIDDITLDEEYFERIEAGQWSNDILAGLMDALHEFGDYDYSAVSARSWANRASDLRYCHKSLFWNHYQQQYLKDFQRTFKCHDRFCPLCAKDSSNKREQKFRLALEELSQRYDLYHLSMTLENCRGSVAPWQLTPSIQKLKGLTETIGCMQKCFFQFHRYLADKVKIRDVDLIQYGYGGAVRSLEVTFYSHQEYHPHYHVILLLKKDNELSGENVNKFSWDKYTDDYHPFTDFEILVQKIWFMILNGIKVVKSAKPVIDENIKKHLAKKHETLGYGRHLYKIDQPITLDNIKLGYSCHMRKVDEKDCHEVFKYIVKPDEGESMSIGVLQDLDAALYKKRAVEAYGDFRKYKLADGEIDDSFDAFYDELVKAWDKVEKPVKISESAAEARENIKQGNCQYVSRKSVRSFVRKLGLDEELPVIVAEPKRVQEFAQMMMDLPEFTKQGRSRKKYLDADERRASRSKGNK